jgi:hypothetical protein
LFYDCIIAQEWIMRFILLALLLVSACLWAAEPSPHATVHSLWRALSSEPGHGADAATLQRLFHQDAVVFGMQHKDGAPLLKARSARQFIQAQSEAGSKGFYECEILREIRSYDGFATVYSVVESRTDKTSIAPDFVGVNSIQLARTEDTWRILSLFYHVQRDDLPIAVDGGKSGQCLGETSG